MNQILRVCFVLFTLILYLFYFAPKLFVFQILAPIMCHGRYQCWKLLIWGEAEQKARELKIKAPGPLQEHRLVVLVFSTLCLQFTPVSDPGHQGLGE